MLRFLTCIVALVVTMTPLPSQAQSLSSDASHAVIMDYDTGDILWEKNGTEEMIPASMTKVMTAHLVFDRIRTGEVALTDTFTVSETAWREGGWASGGSTMGLAIGDQPTVEELLRGVIILSGNDACIVLAEGISGSEEVFAEEMTAMARRMGLESATFRNSTGLDEDGHRMSATDLAELARQTIAEFPEFYALYAETEYEWRGISQPNRNPLLGRMDGADGLKTGHLDVSGFGLTASAVREGVRRIVVINGMETRADRARESERLMRLAFSAFDTRSYAPGEIALPRVPVWLGTSPDIGVELRNTVRISGLRRGFTEATAEIVYDGPLEAPISAGDEVARLVLTLPGARPVEAPLYASEAVPREGFVGRALEGLNQKLSGGA